MGLLHIVMLLWSHLRDVFDARHKWQPRQQRQQQICQEAYDAGQVALQAGLDTAGMHRKGLDLGPRQPGPGTAVSVHPLLAAGSQRYAHDYSHCAMHDTTFGECALSLPVCSCHEAHGMPQPTVC